MPDLVSQHSLEYVSSALHILYFQHYSQIIACTIAVYDHALTFDREVELIWKKRWSKSKIFYLLCRYVGNSLNILNTVVYVYQQNISHSLYVVFLLLCSIEWLNEMCGSPSLGSCLWGIRSTGYLSVVCTLITQLVMRFRIQALYNNHSLLTRFLFGVLICETISLSTIVLLSMEQVEGTLVVVDALLPDVYVCTQIHFPSWSWLFWLPILLFDTLLFVLAIGIVIQSWRQLPPEQLTKHRMGPSLMTILLRDNFVYFFFAFAMYLMTTIVWLTADTRYFSIPSAFAFSVTSILGSRLILNLCEAYYNPLNHNTRGNSEWDTRLRWELNTVAGGSSIESAPTAEELRDVEIRDMKLEASESTATQSDTVQEGLELSTFTQASRKEECRDEQEAFGRETC